ncbi:MAG: protein kinase [Rubripirellula sp.]
MSSLFDPIRSHDESDEPLAMRHLTNAQKDQLGVLLEEYMTALESGMPPSVDTLTRSCPELREPLRACVGGLESLHRMAAADNIVEAATIDDSRKLGDFELHEEIGRGGMGVVYRATQSSLRRTVAIKLLPLTSVLDPRQLTRFQQEAEAAASLQHPNIVPVFAVGCQRGIHYYAMQLIRGTSLDVSVRDKARDDEGSLASKTTRKVDWRSSVVQAAQVADGLHAAHELGIIHRDIKPSNLIVDQNGKPWITDFGLARIQNDVSLTQSGDVIGTMRYMSPEQARGESAIVDGRTDVYSLGATLYEMLTGRPAHDGEDAPSILRQIDSESLVPLRKHCPELPRDLETVVAKAMASRRDERYETAQEFAEDLRRLLTGEPTIARPPTLLDHGVRFATKYRAAVATIAVFGLLALAGFAVSNTRLAAANRVSDARATIAKNNEAITREAIDRLGTQMAELLADIPAANSVRHRLLNETLDYYQRLAHESALLASPDRDQQLDLAMTHGKIGSFQGELGLSADARQSLAESQRRYAAVAAQFPNDTELQLQWSISQNNLAETFAGSGDFDSAAEWFAKAIAIQNRLQSESNETASTELATTLNNLGRMLTDSANSKEAEVVFQRAIDLLGDSSADLQLRSTIQSNLAGLLTRVDASRATEIARQSLTIQLDQLKATPGDAKAATQVVLTLNTLASAQARQSQHREAIDSLRQAIDISGQLRSRWPDQVRYRRDLGISLNQLGLSLSAVGRTDRAAGAFENASKHARALLKVYGDDARLHSMLGSTLNNLAFLKQQLGDQQTANRLYQEAIEHQRQAVSLAPQVPRYQAYLTKHQHNLRNLRGET